MGKKYKQPVDPRDRMSSEERKFKREQDSTCDEYYKESNAVGGSIGAIFQVGLGLLSIFGGRSKLPPGTVR